jgi:hypothetical protein
MKHKRKDISVEKRYRQEWNVRYKAIKRKKVRKKRTLERKKMKQNAK